jgi:lipopolysaccharide export system protein LptA
VTITGETADIDEKNEIAVLYGDVNIVDPKYSLKTEELRIAFEDKQFQATGFVQFKKVSDPEKEEPDLSLPKKDRLREYFAGQQFELFCRELFYDWEAKQLTAVDSVRLVHPSFNGALDRLDYNDETKEYEMSGNVDLEVTDYDWIFANELVEPEDEQRVRALAEGSTLVKCDRLRYAEEAGIAEFYAVPGGEVLFKQQTRDVRAAYAEVNDETKDFYAEGAEGRQVRYHQTDGSWLFDGGLVDREEVSEELSEALEQELAVDADTLAYNFDRKRMELHGNVVVKSAQRSITAAEVIQDETAKFFLLRGNVKIEPDANSTVQAAQVYLDTENDVITFVGLVQGQMRSEDIPSAEEVAEEGEYTPAAGLFQQQAARQASGTGDANIAEGREG